MPIERDPGVREPIYSVHSAKLRLRIRLTYLREGPFRPSDKCRLNASWIESFPWLEFSPTTQAAYCLQCFVMDTSTSRSSKQGGRGAFTFVGFKSWDTARASFKQHEGDYNSSHNKCFRACADLMNVPHHVDKRLKVHNILHLSRDRARLLISIGAARWLAKQGLAFRGHDESEDSTNRGNFLELIDFAGQQNPKIADNILGNAPGNNSYTSPDVQRGIIRSCAAATQEKILTEVGSSNFCILADESRDVSSKEQMTIIVRFVDDEGCIIERFLGLVHVKSTKAEDLWTVIEELLQQCKLPVSRIRGQGFDGASNMSGPFNGLSAKILARNQSAFYIHCFAHQLQLALVDAAKEVQEVWQFFSYVSTILNLVLGSPQRREILQDQQAEATAAQVKLGELETGRGKNQRSTLQRPAQTRWGSYYSSVCSLMATFQPTLAGLLSIAGDSEKDARATAKGMIKAMCTFEFCLNLHIMYEVLGITNDLCELLQFRDQEIIQAMFALDECKQELAKLRAEKWEQILGAVVSFCEKEKIAVPSLAARYDPGRCRPDFDPPITNTQYYQCQVFNVIIDGQLATLNARFSETSMTLLRYAGCFNPRNGYAAFNIDNLVALAEMYKDDFDATELRQLRIQLGNFRSGIASHSVLKDTENTVTSAAKLARVLVRERLHLYYHLVYRLLTLVLTLPVSTATAERSFSSMKFIKNLLRNSLSDQMLADLMMLYLEKDHFDDVTDLEVLFRYQTLRARRSSLV